VNFEESYKYLLSLGNEVSAMKLGLESMTRLLNALGDPQKQYLKVQVAGTNGKGSVCAFVEAVCVSAGIKVGVTTSPHLISVTERIRVDGKAIGETEFADLATRVRAVAEELVALGELETVPTYFEQVTAAALVAFAEARVKLAVLETGLGGRLDATTAAGAEIAAITRIDLDHQQYLGDTIEQIAAEKAAIITGETRDVVIGAQTLPVMKLLRERCRELGIEPLNDEYSPWRVLPENGGKAVLDLSVMSWPPIELGLKGLHQVENAQTAIQIIKGLIYHGVFPHGEDGEIHVVEGLKNARHPGRLQSLAKYLFDGAHNIGGAKALRAYLDEFINRPITIIFGAMKDKDVAEIAEILFPAAKTLILTRTNNERSMETAELERFAKKHSNTQQIIRTESVDDALKKADELFEPGSLILVTGSLYLVGEAQKILSNNLSLKFEI
jgi:dihydrofolate synthase/folylpolyglutamate synthase